MKTKTLFLFCAMCLVTSCSTNSTANDQPQTDSTQNDSIKTDSEQVNTVDDSVIYNNLLAATRFVYKKYGPVKFPFCLDSTKSNHLCETGWGAILGILPDTSKYFDVFIDYPAGAGYVEITRLDKKGKYISNESLLYVIEEGGYVDINTCLATDEYMILQKDLSFVWIKDNIALWRYRKDGQDYDPFMDSDDMLVPDSADLTYEKRQLKGKITADRKVVYSVKGKFCEKVDKDIDAEFVNSASARIYFDWKHPQEIDAVKILGVKSQLRKQCDIYNVKDQVHVPEYADEE